jgi:hypothetical protein
MNCFFAVHVCIVAQKGFFSYFQSKECPPLNGCKKGGKVGTFRYKRLKNTQVQENDIRMISHGRRHVYL